jgi:diacylglycerol kinase
VRIKAGKAPQRRSRARENLSGRFATLFGPLTAAIGLQTLLVIHTTLGANLVQVLAALTFGFGMAVMARYKLDAAFAASAQDRAFRHLAVTGSLLVVAMILLACHLVGTVWPITAMAVLSGQIGTLIGTTHSSLGYSAETLAVRPDEARLMGRAALLPSLLAALAIMFATSMMPAAAIFVACAAALVVSVRFPDAIADLFD